MKRISLNLYYGCIKENESYFLSQDENLNDNMFLLFSGERDWKGLYELLPQAKKNEIYLVNIISEFKDSYDKVNNRIINKSNHGVDWSGTVKKNFHSIEMFNNDGFIIDSAAVPFYRKKYGKIDYDCSRTYAESFEMNDYLVNLCPVNPEKDKNGFPMPADFTMTVNYKLLN